MLFNLRILLLIVFVSVTSGDNNLNTDADVYWIEHSIDAGEFKEIGHLNLRTIRQSQNTAQFQSYNSASDQSDADQPKLNLIQHSTPVQSNLIDEATKNEIIQTLEQSNSSFYRLRLCKRLPAVSCQIGSFIYLKNLVDAGFRINLTVSTGVNNRLTSITIKAQPNANQNYYVEDLQQVTFLTTIQNIRTGQAPDTETYLEKVKKEVEQKEKGAQAGNESFLSKYWMYIVPFLVVMFLMNMVNPEAGAGSA